MFTLIQDSALRLDELALFVAACGALVLGLKEIALKPKARTPHDDAAHPEPGAHLKSLHGHR